MVFASDGYPEQSQRDDQMCYENKYGNDWIDRIQTMCRTGSIIFEYSLPYAINRTAENPPKQGLSLGMEFGSSTHGFQVFASNYDKLNPQMNVGQNIVNDFFAGDILLGFNITVRF